MKQNLNILVTFLRVYQFFIAAIGALVFFLLFYTAKDESIKLTSITKEFTVNLTDLNEVQRALFLLFTLLIIALFFTVAEKIVAVLTEFKKDEFFTNKVISNLNVAGKLVMGLFALLSLSKTIQKNIMMEGGFSIDVKTEYLIGALILFILSSVFARARQLQEENKLTI